MLNCVVIDDDPVAVNLIKHFITNTEGLYFTESFSSSIEAVNYLRSNAESIDLLFLDVEMPDMTGIELLESVPGLPPVILITSKEKYAVKAFELHATDYIVKPVEYSRFLKAVNSVTEKSNTTVTTDSSYLFLKENGVLTKAKFSDIKYCEALGDYIKIYINDKTIVINATMKKLEEKLKNFNQFIRIHRSFIVNLDYLENFDTETAIVANKILPIGNKYKSQLMSRLNII